MSLHFTTVSGQRICEVAFHAGEIQDPVLIAARERFGEALNVRNAGAKSGQAGYWRALVAARLALHAAHRVRRSEQTFVYGLTTCPECRVVADWAFEHGVKRNLVRFNMRGPEAKKVAKRFGLMATKVDGRWGLKLHIFDGRSLAVRLRMAEHPFREKPKEVAA